MKSINLGRKVNYLFEILWQNQKLTIKLKTYFRLCELVIYYEEKLLNLSLLLAYKLINWLPNHRVHFSKKNWSKIYHPQYICVLVVKISIDLKNIDWLNIFYEPVYNNKSVRIFEHLSFYSWHN